MPCNTESKTIGDHEYSVTQWSAEKAMLMKMKLAKQFGPSLAIMASKNEDDGDEAEGISKAIELIFKNNSPEEVVAMVKETVMGTACDGKRITETSFNELFSGDNLLTVYMVFIFVLQVNYANLLKGRLVGGLMEKLQVSK